LDKSKGFIEAHMELLSEDTINYLINWIIDLKVDEVGFFLLKFIERQIFSGIHPHGTCYQSNNNTRIY